MTGPAPPIASRADFDAGLQRALIEVAALHRDEPGDPTLIGLRHQLEALVAWTADGRALTTPQRERVTMGLVAQRELKADVPALAALLIALHTWILQQMPDGP
jgi:hypothetical protein